MKSKSNTSSQMNQELFRFIEQSPSAFHTVKVATALLKEAGFTELKEKDAWKMKKGGSYYVTRNASSLIAFRVGDVSAFRIVAAHTDSPCFKIKENAELHTTDKYTRLNTEGYGGMLCSTWLDKPLSIAGRVVVRDAENGVREKLIDFGRDLVLIPNVAIHMNREANDGYKWNKQVDMMPLFAGGSEEGAFLQLLLEELNKEATSHAGAEITTSDILGSDLYLYNREKPTVWGAKEEFISAPRLDDLQCLFAGLKAMTESKAPKKGVTMLACFDNEEVGSGTKQGAASTFLYDVIRRIMSTCEEGSSEESFYRAIAESFMISADNAHAVHPNHPEHTDAGNTCYMNEGIVVKSHAGQKYTSDAVSIAKLKLLAEEAKVSLQYFANRSDKLGGSTLGNLVQAQVSMDTVDIGLPQLAMHSSYETAGAKDTESLVQLLKTFYL